MRKVLFVDDEHFLLNSIRRALRKEPYMFFYAMSGAEALEILKNQEDMDIVITDENMPGMSGTELLQICREQYPSAVRIMLTGRNDVESAMNAIYLGWVYRYLHKPVSASDLAATIHIALIMKSLLKDGESDNMTMSSDEQVALVSQFAHHDEDETPTDEEAEDTKIRPVQALEEIYQILSLEQGKGNECEETLQKVCSVLKRIKI